MTAATIAPTGTRPLAAVLLFLRRSLGFELTELEQLRADVAAYRDAIVRVEELEAEKARLLLANSDLQILLEMARETVERQQVEFQDAKLTRADGAPGAGDPQLGGER